MTLAYPWVLLLLFLLIPLIYRTYWAKTQVALRYSSTQGFKKLPVTVMGGVRHGLFWLKIAAFTLLVIAVARPQIGKSVTQRKSEGLDIVLAIDTSGSMRALDLKLNGTRYDRLTVVKNVLVKFIEKRIDDRIGMVVFGSEAFTQAPLTLDHEVLLTFLGDLQIEMAGPSTAIGDAIATASKRLKDLESKSKIIILLTDGENTAGTVDPREAAKAASTLGIKIYTIGVGSNGQAPMPSGGLLGMFNRNVRVNLDEKLLKEVAALTGGQSFLARDTQGLVKVYDTIDKLEKTEIQIDEFIDYKEAAHYFLWPAIILIILDSLAGMSRLRSLP